MQEAQTTQKTQKTQKTQSWWNMTTRNTWKKSAIAIAAITLVGTVAFAQTGTPTNTGNGSDGGEDKIAEAARQARTTDGRQVRNTRSALTDERAESEVAGLSAARLPVVAAEKIGDMKDNLDKSLARLQQAREKGDSVQISCLNDKITAIKGMINVAERSSTNLQVAMAEKADGRARDELKKIVSIGNRVEQLQIAASSCVGADAAYTGNMEVEVEIDESLLAKDPYYGDTNFLVTPEQNVVAEDGSGLFGDDFTGDNGDRPPVASGFQ